MGNSSRQYREFVAFREAGLGEHQLVGSAPFAEVVIISSGKGNKRDKNHYSAATVQRAAPKFDGAHAYIDHPGRDEEENRPERSVRDQCGWYSHVRSRMTESGGCELIGRLNFMTTAPGQHALATIRDALRYAKQYPNSDRVLAGISINAAGPTREIMLDGEVWNDVEEIEHVASADIVTFPGRGGKPVSLREAEAMLLGDTTEEERQGATYEDLKAIARKAQDSMRPEDVAALVQAATAIADANLAELADAQDERKKEEQLAAKAAGEDAMLTQAPQSGPAGPGQTPAEDPRLMQAIQEAEADGFSAYEGATPEERAQLAEADEFSAYMPAEEKKDELSEAEDELTDEEKAALAESEDQMTDEEKEQLAEADCACDGTDPNCDCQKASMQESTAMLGELIRTPAQAAAAIRELYQINENLYARLREANAVVGRYRRSAQRMRAARAIREAGAVGAIKVADLVQFRESQWPVLLRTAAGPTRGRAFAPTTTPSLQSTRLRESAAAGRVSVADAWDHL